MKRHITKQEEFEIMKLVLDKFLWLGVAIMAYGFYKIINVSDDFYYGLAVLFSGALLLIIFIWVLMKEYNYVKR